jgi:hypothetical protein
VVLLGQPAAALAAAEGAVRLLPEARDVINGPSVAILREVLIKTQERAEEGYAELERLLGAFALQPRGVAVRPEWRLLRRDPRVQQIFDKAIAKAAELAA